MHAHHWKTTAAACALSMLAACGGGDDPAPGPTQTAIGTISSFGSLVVNGVRFDDTAASITMDDSAGTRDRLRVGMVVQVRGRINANGTGVANTIRYNDCVQGPITAMNQVQNTVTVLGQTVLVDDDTVFDGVTQRDMNSFAIGDQVEVSCLPDPANNRLRATRMERQGLFQNGVSELEVKGTVSNLDAAAGTCTIDGLTVNFSGIAAGSRPAGLANGMTVEVGGSNFANGILTADRLRDRDRDRISYPDGDGLEVEGYVADFVSIANFTVAGQAVNAANAVIRNGTAADIRNGLKVEAEGVMTNNVLVASVLVVKLQASVHVESGLQAKDAALGTLTMLGRALKLTADTVLRDRLASADQPAIITLASLNPADRLEVNAYEDAAGDLIATRVERTAADSLVVVKGPADAKVPTTQLTLAGFGVTTGANSRYRDLSGALVDAATFYAAVAVPPAVPTMVRARGVVASLATNVVDATRDVGTTGELEIGED
ncbi:MAG TPA: DUF5666 domain-containing protein [Piscinibacter sp.]|jgi:hypothetical protein|uniref:DUF5666 domain-containing protein n=1 Tax=Piscinibacter sp. TaxID=1903157 RepID=UPI001B7931BA|nr:DUF5666 domain-containing protein [Piscinibacter sp.]MBK7533437.1 hypothetical protein [Piscinibacter sp.]MBL0092414.1 hypothetical protein [Piscinibacter sp.]MBP6542946.1 hypothetical protein [Piscinibacter sp.]HOY35861.1 DUF5666 domain-containing protein [Piscinibacter sp.]HPG79402.1 DUF5666 domain-containing protein [Piscinibacter sp.]